VSDLRLRQRRQPEATQAESWKHTSMQTHESKSNCVRHLQAMMASVLGVDLKTRHAKDKVMKMAESLSRWSGRSYRIAVSEYCCGS
jgi:hypothetical protein